MKKLVRRYKQSQSQEKVGTLLRNQLIIDYSHLIRFVAQKIISRLPANVDIDDLISSGVIGLIDAIEKYDPARDNKFKTYAEFRIRGSILDELRAQDWVPRSIRDKSKKLERAHNELEKSLGRAATEEEICKKMMISSKEYHAILSQVRTIGVFSLDEIIKSQNNDKKSLIDYIENIKSENPYLYIKEKGMYTIVRNYIEKLPKNQKLVLSLYYYEDLNLKEIGKILEVTESRVSQLHTQAVARLRFRLKDVLAA